MPRPDLKSESVAGQTPPKFFEVPILTIANLTQAASYFHVKVSAGSHQLM